MTRGVNPLRKPSSGVELDHAPYPKCMTWPLPVPGMGVEEWQAGRCAGCGLAGLRLLLDHDHVTGLTRGYLCSRCNHLTETDRPRWVRWRAGWNPATLLGIRDEYVGWGSALEAYERRTEATQDELRDAILLLPSSNPPTPPPDAA